MDYRVKVDESGTEFEEKVEVDISKQTEVFKVPAHNNLDQADVMYDFKLVSLHEWCVGVKIASLNSS